MCSKTIHFNVLETAASSTGMTPNLTDFDALFEEIAKADSGASSEQLPVILPQDEYFLVDLNTHSVLTSLPSCGTFNEEEILQPPLEEVDYGESPDLETGNSTIDPQHTIQQSTTSMNEKEVWGAAAIVEDPPSPGINVAELSDSLLEPKEITCSFKAEEIPKLVASNQMLLRNISTEPQKVFHICSGRGGRFSFDIKYASK